MRCIFAMFAEDIGLLPRSGFLKLVEQHRGHAGRFHLSAGAFFATMDRGGWSAALMADVRRGLYVTELIGNGVNPVTGDYSRGAAGFVIENGELAQPVDEITVAGNLLDMFRTLRAADDLEFRRSVNVPTLRVEGMTVAGA